jgi:regulator of sirC expression with transglutaminase-like and TPR domain
VIREARELARLFKLPDERVDLGRAAFLLARAEYAELDLEAELTRLDDLARQAAPFVAEHLTPALRVDGLRAFLGEVCGFQGNEQDYYDPTNSFLNRVLDRRAGIPISLSVLYMEVGRRLGITLFGVGLPGHFVVKYQAGRERILLDPYHGGRTLTSDQCREIVQSMYQGQVPFREDMLAAVDKRYILVRMLSNLRAIYLEQRQLRKALAVVEMLLALNPASADDLKLRGLLSYQLGRREQSRQDLESYLFLHPRASDAEQIQQVLQELKRVSAMMN